MYLTTIRIRSECSLAETANAIQSRLFSINTYPINSELNNVLLLLRLKDASNVSLIIKILRKDFVNLSVASLNDESYLIFGIKKGHGVLYPIFNHDALMLYPIIALPNTESFMFLAYNKDDIDNIAKDIERINKIDFLNYDKVSSGNDIIKAIMRNFREIYFYDINETERKILLMAYRMGYFEWPKKVKIEALAKELNYTKPMVSYYLRRIEKKIIEKLFS